MFEKKEEVKATPKPEPRKLNTSIFEQKQEENPFPTLRSSGRSSAVKAEAV